MVRILRFYMILFSIQFALGQDSSSIEIMHPSLWHTPKDALFERFDDRETLLLKSGRAILKNQTFSNGTIEVEVYANTKRSFAGIAFRKQNDTMEEVYMRMHKSRQVDAVQYTPIFHKESNWQLYREYQAQVHFKNTGWNKLRIEVNHQQTEVYVNDEKVMTIDTLRTGHAQGEIGLFALFTNRFSNFKVTPKDPIEKSTTESQTSIDPNIISKWEITKAKPYDSELISFQNFLNEKYTSVKTESSGLLPISKYTQKTSSGNFEQNKENYIIAKTSILSNSEKTTVFSFDYSDQIIVYFNGKILFKGNNSFRTKGVQYMGHLGITTNKLFLPLQKGLNTIHCVVIDKSNGWGLMGKLEK